ncbi:hypothetical protein BKA67DRAFT_29840 [Truncatella angustata]|uniref:Histone deacetylase complex subunit SAP30 Sin3 binding domain-containing protein n=1 Tax=Truncatella angustata TaxID=152316 RepID=A0A9P9A413_9PEZI|nr:uncharacterized protein BKA67DRAFT_29840 [Truncatella angustata]KAH6659825.1 hypothetical protein BKA67DRAFT_29840 [Truncatella angustata]
MPPAKLKTNHHDDSKSETPNSREKNSHVTKDNHHTNGGTKMRRVASSAGSNLREVTLVNGHSAAAIAPPPVAPPAAPPGLDWSSFDREVLHDYRREHNLDTPTAFTHDYHKTVLSRPGGIGLYSPSMARRREYRRQGKNELTQVVRKHFNGLGVQENEVVVNFLHRVKTPGVYRPRRNKNLPHASPMP